jgi:hypothetical protein
LILFTLIFAIIEKERKMPQYFEGDFFKGQPRILLIGGTSVEKENFDGRNK